MTIKCVSCNKEVTDDYISFKCPKCKRELVRCNDCRKSVVKYTCPECEFEGP